MLNHEHAPSRMRVVREGFLRQWEETFCFYDREICRKCDHQLIMQYTSLRMKQHIKPLKMSRTVVSTSQKIIEQQRFEILLPSSLMKNDKLEAIICYSKQKVTIIEI